MGKAEAADCIIPDKEREREATTTTIMIENRRRFPSVDDKRALGDSKQESLAFGLHDVFEELSSYP